MICIICVAREKGVLNETCNPFFRRRSSNERIEGLHIAIGSVVPVYKVWSGLKGRNVSFASKGSGRTSHRTHRRCMSGVLKDEQDLTRQKNEGKAFWVEGIAYAKARKYRV